jgi:hypothetical protein
MADKIISGAVTDDARIANTIESPTKGVPFGPGPHVVIPEDWFTQSMVGTPPPGCTAAQIERDGTMRVTDRVQTQLAIPSIRTATSDLVGAVALTAFDAKVALAVIAPSAAVEK